MPADGLAPLCTKPFLGTMMLMSGYRINTGPAREVLMNGSSEFVPRDAMDNGSAYLGNDIRQISITWYDDTIDLWPIDATVHAKRAFTLLRDNWRPLLVGVLFLCMMLRITSWQFLIKKTTFKRMYTPKYTCMAREFVSSCLSNYTGETQSKFEIHSIESCVRNSINPKVSLLYEATTHVK